MIPFICPLNMVISFFSFPVYASLPFFLLKMIRSFHMSCSLLQILSNVQFVEVPSIFLLNLTVFIFPLRLMNTFIFVLKNCYFLLFSF